MAKRKAFPLRIDPRLYAELEAWAGEEMRSVNGQIEYLLKQSVIRRKGKRVFKEKTKDGGEEGSADAGTATNGSGR